MTPLSVQHARDKFRQRNISPRYSGFRHLALTVVCSLAVIVVCAILLDGVTAFEWMVVPITFLYANLSEYLGHRGPMHHKTPLLGPLFQRHAIEHHSFFTDEAPSFDTSKDFKAVLFPPVMLIFFFGCFATPVGALLYFLASPNIAFLFVITATAYFLNYELLHFCYHLDERSWIGKLPFMKTLRRHHTVHHNRALMTHYNFNITYPICDFLFRTTWRGRDVPVRNRS